MSCGELCRVLGEALSGGTLLGSVDLVEERWSGFPNVRYVRKFGEHILTVSFTAGDRTPTPAPAISPSAAPERVTGSGPSANSSTRGSPRSARFSSYFWIASGGISSQLGRSIGEHPSCGAYDPPRTCKARSVLRKVTAHSFQARCSTPVGVWARWGNVARG